MFDVIIRSGTVYDGIGGEPYVADIALRGKFIEKIEPIISDSANIEVDASNLAVSPGFINMLSWANESLIVDGRSQSDIRQGITLEITGEGTSMGPLNQALKEDRLLRQGDIKYDIEWTKLSEYLKFLEKRGISCNIGSFVGATTVRRHVLGDDNRAPNAKELAQMQDLVRQAMQEGAFGVSSALIYAPAAYAKTEELIALASVAAEYDGMYASHLRSEGSAFLEALDEFLEIAKRTNIKAEIYHLKAAGKPNWSKIDQAIEKNRKCSSGWFACNSFYVYVYGSRHRFRCGDAYLGARGRRRCLDRKT